MFFEKPKEMQQQAPAKQQSGQQAPAAPAKK
jgi:hypothetical protein